MGLNFRKSIKIGKNTRINFSKTGGIGISTGVKGARVSINQKGIRTSIGKGGIRYSKNVSFKNNNDNKSSNPINQNIVQPRGSILKTINDNNKMLQNNTEKEIEQFQKEHYTKHIKLLLPGFILFFIGIVFPPVLLLAAILLLSGLICMIKNWKRINDEYKIRIKK